VERKEHLAIPLGTEEPRESGGADEVGHEHGEHPPFPLRVGGKIELLAGCDHEVERSAMGRVGGQRPSCVADR
jgi:hypothetical protein